MPGLDKSVIIQTMFVDDMELEERRFYERTRLKVAWSIFVASIGLAALALCSVYAGEANSASIMSDTANNKEVENSYHALSSGYGKNILFSC